MPKMLCVFLALSGPGSALLAVSVDEAYRLIPHRQTIFQSASAQMPGAESAYLVAFFQAIDQAIVAKVSSSRGSTVAQAYAPVWTAWAQLQPPSALKATRERVKAAIEEQQAFLLEVERKQTGWNMSHPRVRSASAKLEAAYGDLMRIYGNEGATSRHSSITSARSILFSGRAGVAFSART